MQKEKKRKRKYVSTKEIHKFNVTGNIFKSLYCFYFSLYYIEEAAKTSTSRDLFDASASGWELALVTAPTSNTSRPVEAKLVLVLFMYFILFTFTDVSICQVNPLVITFK